MKIAIASDHAGFAYKEAIKRFLQTLGPEIRDFGTHSDAPVDYPAFFRPAAEAVALGESERGIALGGSGNGEAIAANKVRASVAHCVGVMTRPAGRASTTTPTCWPSASEPFPPSWRWKLFKCG